MAIPGAGSLAARHRIASVHDDHGTAASHTQKSGVGRLLHRLAAHTGTKHGFLNRFGANPAAAIEMSDPSIAMSPHARYPAHAGYGIAGCRAINAGKTCRHAEFDKLAHQGDVTVRHAADMAAIGVDGECQLACQHVLKRLYSGSIAAKCRLGEGNAAKRADLPICGGHAPPVHRKAPDLHLDIMCKPCLKRLVGGITVPAVIHRQHGQTRPHQVGAPVREAPCLVGVDPVADQIANTATRFDAAFGTQIAKPGKAGKTLVIIRGINPEGQNVATAGGIAAPRVL